MNEFSLIDVFFKKTAHGRDDVIYGIGDDAACVRVATGQDLLISTDTLVAEVHFLSTWDPYDMACKAVMANVSDMAAMAAKPCWLTLSLTLPEFNQRWLERFSQGLHDSLKQFNIALIGGDTTCGPLSITITIHGLTPAGRAIRRCGAKPGDKIYVSGMLGAAALAVSFLQRKDIEDEDRQIAMRKLQRPSPRVDLADILQQYASAAIDISDGLSADLNHICTASHVGASLFSDSIPIHALVKKYQSSNAVNFVLGGGDDYELCFTVSAQKEEMLSRLMAQTGLICYPIGYIEEKKGLRLITEEGQVKKLIPRGYSHF
ncbi:thiamine-phosphate kinase [Legionella fairfieldensis]|uniref:thiamine-phosphate kinase n=1 Tax=Legionella fairfieldensis TaxID=45064 RepID=UPI0005614FE7|nr:thiamine-phosphate kinase [Legionella fairfieldensis]